MPKPRRTPSSDFAMLSAPSNVFGGKLVLKDMAGTTYQLDDQQKAKKFAGKEVKVVGSLDTSSNTIHVENIDLSS
jgi:Protein of unknown function (DUF5818)